MTNKGSEAGLEARVKNTALVKARETLMMTQEKAAEKIGISKLSLFNYENIKRYPSLATQRKICSFYRQNGLALRVKEAFPEYLKVVAPRKTGEGKSIPDELLVSLNSINGSYLPDYHKIDKQTVVEELLKDIPGRYKEILIMRYGLGGENPKTFMEVAEEYNVTRERIRQLEDDAISLLRKKAGAYRRKEMI